MGCCQVDGYQVDVVEFIYCSIEGEIYWNLMLKVMMITFIEYLNVV